MDKLLVFKNPTQLEMVFLEPGFFTYYRDMEVENVQLRVHVESHALEPLVGEWKVDLPAFLASIIKGIRLAFSACVNLTGITDFKKVYFVKRNFDLLVKDHVKNADPRNPRDELVFPLPNQWHEILHAHAQALAFPSWNLFTKPPETFDELEGRGTYLESRRQAKLGNVADIISKLAATLPVFNKAGQKYAFFLVLVELGRLAVKVGNTVECKAKFDLALDFAMKNDAMVNPDEIITIQEEYAQASIKLGDTDNAIRQYTLLFNYLERSRPDSDSKRIAVLVQLNKIFISRPDSGSLDHEIQSNFKKIKEFGDKHKDRFVTSSYYHVLGLYHEQQKKPSQAIPAYQRAIAEAEVMGLIDPVIASTVRLASMFLYGKKKNLAQAEKLLLRANEIVGKTDDLGSELQVYEMLYDLYNQKDDMELAAHFNKESTRLRVALKARGN